MRKKKLAEAICPYCRLVVDLYVLPHVEEDKQCPCCNQVIKGGGYMETNCPHCKELFTVEVHIQ